MWERKERERERDEFENNNKSKYDTFSLIRDSRDGTTNSIHASVSVYHDSSRSNGIRSAD